MNTDRSLAQQQGVTLIEVLVAILVLSFGLLGMLGLTANGIKMSSSSQYRTIAAQQLAAMADMINANPYIVSKYSPPTSTLTKSDPPPTNNPCLKTTTGCPVDKTANPTYSLSHSTYAVISTNDYEVWLTNLKDSLPGGWGIVCLDASPADGNLGNFGCSGSGRPTIKICWNENARISTSGGGASGSDSSTDTCISTQL